MTIVKSAKTFVEEKIIGQVKRFVTFVGETRSELKKVAWPDRTEVYNTTIVVLVASAFFGFYLFLVDMGLQQGIHWITNLFRN